MPNLPFNPDSDAGAENPPLIDELIGAVANGDVKQRLRVLQRVTDLFVAGSRGYSGEQIALFDDVLQQLTTEIEVKARARLATARGRGERAAQARAHARLRRRNRGGRAGADPFPAVERRRSGRKRQQQESGASLAIAQRLKLSETVTDVLVERGNERVVRKVARNKGARFSLAGYDKLTMRARSDAG